MVRVLRFGADDQDKFDKIWEGFVIGTRVAQNRAQGSAPNVATSRLRAKLSRKLKGISKESDRAITVGILYRELETAPRNLLLEQPELELLVKTMEEVEWLPETADIAFDVIDWVSAADKED